VNVQRPDIISVSYRILHDRRIGFIPLHEDVLVIAAGNSPDESSIANLLPAPLMNRVIKFKIDPPTEDRLLSPSELGEVDDASLWKQLGQTYLRVLKEIPFRALYT